MRTQAAEGRLNSVGEQRQDGGVGALGIVESLHGAECFRSAIAQDVRDRMVKPLARARQTAEDGAGVGTDAPGRSCC